MMEKLTVTYKEDNGNCPKCGEKAEFQEGWDRLFESYDRNTPQMNMIIQRLYNEGEPKYVCQNCNIEVLVKP